MPVEIERHLAKFKTGWNSPQHLGKDPATGHLANGISSWSTALYVSSKFAKGGTFKLPSVEDDTYRASRGEGIAGLQRNFDADDWGEFGSHWKPISCGSLWGNSPSTGMITPVWSATAGAGFFETPGGNAGFRSIRSASIIIDDYLDYPGGGEMRVALASCDNEYGSLLPMTMAEMKALPSVPIRGKGRLNLNPKGVELKAWICVIFYVVDCLPPYGDQWQHPVPREWPEQSAAIEVNPIELLVSLSSAPPETKEEI